jgi:hypothetical protein
MSGRTRRVQWKVDPWWNEDMDSIEISTMVDQFCETGIRRVLRQWFVGQAGLEFSGREAYL